MCSVHSHLKLPVRMVFHRRIWSILSDFASQILLRNAWIRTSASFSCPQDHPCFHRVSERNWATVRAHRSRSWVRVTIGRPSKLKLRYRHRGSDKLPLVFNLDFISLPSLARCSLLDHFKKAAWAQRSPSFEMFGGFICSHGTLE